MTRPLPILPTLLVAVAVSVMLALGVWQLRRGDEKRDQFARYAAATRAPVPVAWPRDSSALDEALYRPSQLRCERVIASRATAGRNAEGETGWAQVARCALDGGGEAEIVLGWSRAPQVVVWSGGEARGIVAPARNGEARLVAAPPLAGLAANAAPDPGDLPNNHLAYAGQWFFFAVTAAVIYVLALRKRLPRP